MSKPLHVYRFGESHVMHPDCWCGPRLVTPGGRVVWVHYHIDSWPWPGPGGSQVKADAEWVDHPLEQVH